MVRFYRQIAGVVFVAIMTTLAATNISARGSYPSETDAAYTPIRIVPTPTDGGIREEIPTKYHERYEKWKTELLATELGRSQWDRYANDRGFLLTITISGNRKGAGTD